MSKHKAVPKEVHQYSMNFIRSRFFDCLGLEKDDYQLRIHTHYAMRRDGINYWLWAEIEFNGDTLYKINEDVAIDKKHLVDRLQASLGRSFRLYSGKLELGQTWTFQKGSDWFSIDFKKLICVIVAPESKLIELINNKVTE